jgi:hypothetical protein
MYARSPEREPEKGKLTQNAGGVVGGDEQLLRPVS